jgi:hypothetical protein
MQNLTHCHLELISPWPFARAAKSEYLPCLDFFIASKVNLAAMASTAENFLDRHALSFSDGEGECIQSKVVRHPTT